MTEPTSPAGPQPEDGEETVSAGQYAFLCFLTLLNVLNFVDRQLLSSMAATIKPELNLTDTEFGLLTGIVFIVFYALMGLFMGALADMVNRPRLIAAGVALWSLFTALSGAARGFVSLAIPRMFIGVGESVLTPTAMSMLADRFPRSRLGFAAGFYYMGVPIGVGVSLVVAGGLAPLIGWRWCFYGLGILGLLMAVAMLFVKETPRRHDAEAALATEPNVAKQSFRSIVADLFTALRASPALSLTIAGGVATHFVLGAAAFDQLWLVEERGFDKNWIALTAGYLAVVGGIAGNLFGGIASDWWQRHMGSGRAMFLFWVMLLLSPINFSFRLVDPGHWWFFFAYLMTFFQLGAFYGPTFSTVQELVPARIRATVVAFYILMLNLVGLGLGITLSGVLIDALRAEGFAEPYTIALLVFSGLSATAIPLFYFAGLRFERDRARLLEQMG